MNKRKDRNNDKSLEDKDNVKTSSTPSSNFEKSVKIGESIGDLITSKWNSQKKPGKVYIKNRRVHHGEIGTSMGIADAFKDLSLFRSFRLFMSLTFCFMLDVYDF